MNIQKLIIAILIILISIEIWDKYFRQVEPPIQLPPVDLIAPDVSPKPEPPKTITFEDALKSISRADIEKNLKYLASDELEGRMSGKKGNVLAAEFIKKQCESFGLTTEYQKFNIRRVNPGPKNETGDDFTQNIIAVLPGATKPNEIVVCGAHMDHLGHGLAMSRSSRMAIHPGADDNASGTVALLEIARAFSKLKPARTVLFQFYSAEEMGLIGSRYYCENPTFPKGNPNIRSHVFMLNMDMVGYLKSGFYFSGFNAGNSSFDITKIINNLNQKYSFAKRITSQGSGGSDHASFYNKKIPIAFLHTGLHDYYHTPEDTADKINFDGIEQVARYAFELAWKVSNDDVAPVFNYGNFTPMEYTHDHGHPGVPFYIHQYHKHTHEE